MQHWTRLCACCGAAGELWARCIHEPDKGSLFQIQDGKIIADSPVAKFSATFYDSAGTLWPGGPDKVASFDGHAMMVTALRDELDGPEVQALAKDGSGALWVSVVRRGVYRFLSGQWVAYGAIGLPREPAIVETSDDDGGVWFGYTGNRIEHLRDQALQRFTAADGLDVGNATAIHRAFGQVWVGGELGFSQLHGTRFYSIRTASANSIKGISGIASTKSGDGPNPVTANRAPIAWKRLSQEPNGSATEHLSGFFLP